MQFRNQFMTVFVVFVVFVSFSCSVFSMNQKARISTTAVATKDSTNKISSDNATSTRLKPYKDIITSNALTKQGLFTVHKINERYFFEIPTRLFEKDILIVSRIAQAARDGAYGYAGDEIGESQIEFTRGPGIKLFIRLLSYGARSVDSSENGMYHSVKASNLQPIQAVFDIKAIRPDSTAVVIDVTDFLNSDNPLLYFDAAGKKSLGLAFQKDKSYITDVKAFPLNVEVQSINTYLRSELPVTFALNVSFVMLPEQPMKPRFFDNRVGYFKRNYFDYDAPEGFRVAQMITRWRLEPKEEDRERYLSGELVEPKKPIVYYIDPATPKKWVKYLIQGVDDWQKAFEKAGFKHAIYALEAPTNDSTFSLLDARHSALIYKASEIPNAMGPQIHDPRTGEILETHINWYHNIQSLLRDWYMVQAGPNDFGARKMVFDDSLMGQLIRFVCAHEVGHTLGLRHNWGASSTVPTDSLRSKRYLDKNGFCPSIMDYARFNYVAQPEDGLSREELMPRIGVYDEWAIEWGYRWLPQLKTREEEEAYMNQWIIASLSKDKRLWWGEQEAGFGGLFSDIFDPRRQPEDLGDDAMKAGNYGIENLKRVMSHLTNWAVESNRDYSSLRNMYDQVIAQYTRYMLHVANNIGNKYWTEKNAGQAGPVVQFIPIEVQKRAMKFLEQQLLDTPEWLYNKEIFSLVGGYGVFTPLQSQKAVIDWLVTNTNYMTMTWAQTQQPKDAYSFDEFLSDMNDAIFKELGKTQPISFARRNLQKLYIERLLLKGATARSDIDVVNYDFYPIMQKHMHWIVNKINQSLPGYKDEDSRRHLMEVKNRLIQALNSTRFPQVQANVPTLGIAVTMAANALEGAGNEKLYSSLELNKPMECIKPAEKERIYSSCWYPYNFDFSNKNNEYE